MSRARALGSVVVMLALLAGVAEAQHWHGGPGGGRRPDGAHWQGGQHWRADQWRGYSGYARWRRGPWGWPGYYRPHRRPAPVWGYPPAPPPVVYAPPPAAPGLSLFFNIP